MSLPTLNNTNLTTYLNGLNASDWQTFATDMSTGFVSAWSSRFSLSTRWSNALGLVTSTVAQIFIEAANWSHDTLNSGQLLDVVGEAFDSNPAGPSTLAFPIQIDIKQDVVLDPKTGNIIKRSTKITIHISF
jgi:serine protease inhibitor